MKRTVSVAALCVLVLSWCISARASTVDVQAERVVFMDGKEFVPRFVQTLPTKLVVPSGETVTMPETGVFDAIEVAGTLRVRRTGDTSVSFTHLQVLPGGTLDVGTPTDPIPRQFRVTFTIRNVPIDLSRDPLQWGNGIVSFGHRSMIGAQKTEWTKLLAGVPAGATQIQVLECNGCEVGDELFLPDMQQMNNQRNVVPRVESKVTIAAIEGNTITLSKPLDFEHEPIFDPEQNEVLAPRVANLTRNIIVRSENPNGVRGHIADVAHATWDSQYVRYEGLGRTPNETLDNTVLADDLSVVKLGTRQVGRYCLHHHHNHGPGVRRCVGNVLVALSNGVVSKWGDAVHFTSDTLHEGNIAIGFPGAGFVTEDGAETRNVYRRNVGALSAGNGRNPTTNAGSLNCPGCEGAGLWFRGLKNTIDQNEGWNNAIGLNFITNGAKSGLVPSIPGGAPDTQFNPITATAISVDANVTFSNAINGIEFWSTDRFPTTNHVSAHNGAAQALGGQSDDVQVLLRNAKLICNPNTPNTRTVAFGTNSAYVSEAVIEDSQMAGCDEGVHAGMASREARIVRTTMQNRTNVNFASAGTGLPSNPTPVVFDNVNFKTLGSLPARDIVWGSATIWQPGQPLPYVEWRTINPAQGTRGHIINWKGTGQDYSLFNVIQKRSVPSPPSHRDGLFLPPEAGLTVGQAWDKYGIAQGAEVIDDAAALTLPGLFNGFVRPGIVPELGSPKYVVTYPNMLAPAVVETVNGKPAVRMRGLLTGDHTGMKRDRSLVSIDNGTPVMVIRGQGQFYDELTFWSTAVNQGTHTVVTWRVDNNGNRVDSTRLEMPGYYVGQPSTPPPPPPPPTTETNCTDGIDNDNDGMTDAGDTDCPPPGGGSGDEEVISVGGSVVESSYLLRLFDGNPNTTTDHFVGSAVTYALTAPASLTRYTVQPRGLYHTMAPKAWRVEGSTDGTTFVTVNEQVDQSFAGAEVKEYVVTGSGSFTFYRITFMEANGSDRIQLRDIALYGVR